MFALAKALETHGVGVDASDMGIGKTYMSTAIVEHYNVATLVVCPKILFSTWKGVADHFNTELDVINWEMVRTGRTPYGRWVKSPNGGGNWFRWADEIELLIFDEAHQGNGLDTKNAALIFFAKMQGIPVLYLSATPAESLIEFKALGFLLELHKGHDFYPWLRGKGYGLVDGEFKYRFGRQKELELMDKMRRYIFPERGIRLKADDIPGFPETQIEVRGVDLDGSGCRKVNALVEEHLKKLDKHAEENYNMEYPAAERAKLAQACELCKVPAMVQMMNDALAQGRSVPIFVNYRRTVELLYEAVPKKWNPQVVTGVQTDEDRRRRDEAIEMFQSDIARVIILISDAGGVGIGLHDLNGWFARTTLISPGDKAKIFRQVVGRVRRNGAKSKSHQIVVTANGISVDEARRNNLMHKLARMDALNDGLESLRDEDLDLTLIAEELRKKVA